MNRRLYGIWLGDVMFCFSGEISETKVDAWTSQIRKVETKAGWRPFQHAALRLAEIRYPVNNVRRGANPENDLRDAGSVERKGLIGRSLEGLALPAKEAWELLLNWDEELWIQQGIEPGAEMAYFGKAARFALDLLRRGKIAPGVRPAVKASGRRTLQAVVRSAWGPLLEEEQDKEKFRMLAGAMPPICLAAVQHGAGQEEGTPPQRQVGILYSFLTAVIDVQVRAAVSDLGRKLNKARADYHRGYSPLSELWWNSVLTAGQPPDIQGSLTEIEQLTQDIHAAGGGRPESDQEEMSELLPGSFRLCLRIEPVKTAPEGGSLDSEVTSNWRLSFYAEGAEEPSVLIPAGLIWSYPKRDIEIQGRLYSNIKENLLLRLGKAASLAPELRTGLNDPRPEEATLESAEVYNFLSKSVSQLRKNGVTVQMPSRWTREGRRNASLKLKATGLASAVIGRDKEPNAPGLGTEQLITFEADVLLNGERVSIEELADLAASKSPLVLFRGEWIEIDIKEIRQMLKAMKRHENGVMTFREFMHLSSAEEAPTFSGVPVNRVEASGMLSLMMEGAANYQSANKEIPPSLQGTLRPYQERGYQWLSTMRDLGFGALLADDMGLGKTIQVITTLLDGLSVSSAHSGRILIVCPTSLLGNWQREISRFAPQMKMYVHHGGDRLHGERFRRKCTESHVILTTYPLVGRDAKDLQEVEWASVVLDEAQYIKNYSTKQAQSVMKLNAPHRVAMTGTPVENRLSELWSIFQFLNPGYLGTHASFRSRFTGGGEHQQAALQALRKLVAPFLLRRLKSDPDIRKDLPEKIELKSYCTLTPEQARLYQMVTDELMQRVTHETGVGIARKGIVLSSLTRLKQICDHPLLVQGRMPNAGGIARSGKMERLYELLDLIIDNGEAALIFTQYVQMGELLQEYLQRRYQTRPFFLHGSVPKSERDEMVRAFQEGEHTPLFVLSLKAGGVGLNLTRANHVIHFDRWWNPAVENQATDRVFRIGQRKNVEVHKLICQGTLEERIDELIERKRSLSEQVVGSGEQWLTELSNEELKELVLLQEGSVSEEDGK